MTYDFSPYHDQETWVRARIEDEASLLRHLRQCNAQMKAQSNVMTKFYEKTYTDRIFREEPTDLPKSAPLQDCIDYQLDLYTKKSRYIFLTINPKPDVSYQELNELVVAFAATSYAEQYFYVYEIRKAPSSGLHCHFLFYYGETARATDVKAAIKKRFKDIVGDVDFSSQLNIKFIKPECIQQKIDYMLGNKQAKKQTGVAATVAWRQSNNIPPFAESSPPFTCRATNTPQIEEV